MTSLDPHDSPRSRSGGDPGDSHAAPNPFAAPTSFGVGIVGDGADRLPVSGGLRFAGYFIDAIIYIGLSFVVGFTMALLGIGVEFLRDPILSRLFGVLLLIAYYVISEGTMSTTIGKLIVGTEVIAEDGSRPSFFAVLGRSAARVIPFEQFSYFFGDGQMWHDRLSGTRVVMRFGRGSDL